MEQYIGQIKLFCGSFAPKDWAFCNGQLLTISQNTALFSILGTTYGGDGKTNFALPNLQGMAVMHPSTKNPLGAKGGNAMKPLTANNFPPHGHTLTGKLKSNSKVDTQTNPVGNYPANSNGFDKEYDKTGTQNMAADSIVVTSVSTDGSALPTALSNMQPNLAVNFIICTNNGEFPQRP